jgi:putative PIG3 family NAD(P)H quinone oxidoreductase
MAVVEISAAGGPDVLQPARRPLPTPGPGEVLIRVAAAGVNRPDVMQRMGQYPAPPGASDIPGLEVAGTVVAAADDVSAPAVGDTVCALVTGGGYARYCLAAAPLCMHVPEGLDMQRAAALPETYFTVWDNVFRRGKLQPGELFLVHGGASGIGTTAIQLARTAGATVLTTAGTEDKCWACEELGAYAAINYRRQDFVAEVLKLTHGEGVDLILDMIGADYLPRNLEVLATGGRLVQIALQHGTSAHLNLLPIMLKRLTLTGSTLRPRSVAEKAEIARELVHNVWPWLERQHVHPVIHATYPLARAADAHRLLESSQHIGKIVLVSDD